MSADPTQALVRSSRQVLHTRARSFRWGSAFLPPAQADDSALVYAFCRLVDDTADEAEDAAVARLELEELSEELEGRAPARPLVEAYLEVAARRGIHRGAAHELLAGCAADLDGVRLESDAELLRYAYRVAGTVGLMMCGVLGVDDEAAVPRAIDLGIAMQLTNISRDVAEDAERGRVYLPAERLIAAGLSPEEVLDRSADPARLYGVVVDLLDLAERYYRSAEEGMQFIPPRARLAILVAARLYRAIGGRIRRLGPPAVKTRAVVGPAMKAGLVAVATAAWTKSLRAPSPQRPHPADLHGPLKGLPGVPG